MGKRLALACAMLPAPSLLVLDEPFESLDPLVVRRIARALAAQRENGVCVLLSSHLLATVADLCVESSDRPGTRLPRTVSGLIAAHARRTSQRSTVRRGVGEAGVNHTPPPPRRPHLGNRANDALSTDVHPAV
jgi:ABC-type nitrate/sulfonate/bicarbonate transport system ATPase subunit